MSKLNQSAFCWTWITLFVGALIVAGQVRAAVVTFAPEHVNRLIGPGPGVSFPDTVFHNDVFSVEATGPQETLIYNSNASLLTALQLALPGASQYIINSATLTVGTNTDNFATVNTVSGYLVLQNYNTSQVTYNSRLTGTPWTTAGLGAGTDRGSIAVTTGTANLANPTTVTDFTGLGTVVQGWLDNTTPNLGLLFTQAIHDGGSPAFTSYQNVVWSLDVTPVFIPEPTTSLLFGIGGLLVWRRAHRR